jgi:hypothetical protein
MSLLCLCITVAIAWIMTCGRIDLGRSGTRPDQHISACHPDASLSAAFEAAVAPWLVPCKCYAVEDMPWHTHSNTASDTPMSPEDAPQCPPNAAPVVWETLSTVGETAHTLDTLHSDGLASARPCRRAFSMLCRLEQPAVLMPPQAVEVHNDITDLSDANQAVAATVRLTTSVPLRIVDQTAFLASSRCSPTARSTPLAHWSIITGQANGVCSNALCTPGSNAQSVVADMSCGVSHTYPRQAPNAPGTTAQTQLVLMDHGRIPDAMLVDQACAWHDIPVSAKESRLPPSPVGHSDAAQGTGSPAAVMVEWTLFLVAYTLLTTAVALSCVRCGLSALVCCAATGPVGLLLSGTVYMLRLLEVRSST